jgi:hypothetical protein
MSQPPTPYDRSFSFTGWSIAHPTEPHQGDKIDTELDAIIASLQETIDRLNEIQQDDGFVRASALSPNLQAEINAAAASAATAVYATNLAQLSNKATARANLQISTYHPGYPVFTPQPGSPSEGKLTFTLLNGTQYEVDAIKVFGT